MKLKILLGSEKKMNLIAYFMRLAEYQVKKLCAGTLEQSKI